MLFSDDPFSLTKSQVSYELFGLFVTERQVSLYMYTHTCFPGNLCRTSLICMVLIQLTNQHSALLYNTYVISDVFMLTRHFGAIG